MDKEPHRASRKSSLKIESENTPEPPTAGRGAGGLRQSTASLGVAPLKLKNETAIWNWRLAPRARVRVTEMVDAEPYGGAEAAAASSGDGVARRQRRRHSRLGQRRPSSAPSTRSRC